MKTRLFFAFLVFSPSYIFAGNEVDSLLNELDKIIAVHRSFSMKKEVRIDELKRNAPPATSLTSLYERNRKLYKEYRAYNPILYYLFL